MANKPNMKRAEAICSLYKQGFTLTEIAKALKTDHSQVERYLKTYYKGIFGEDYKPFAIKKSERLQELYSKYISVYEKGVYTRTQMCELLGCKPLELEAMMRKYNLHHQWLQTYHHQVTLCNTSKEFRNAVKAFCLKHNFKSVREFTVFALNEVMLYMEAKYDCN